MNRIAILTILVILAALFAGCAEEDKTPPEISNVSASDSTSSSATITWTTDEEATSQVEYGTTGAYGFKGVVGGFGFGHNVTLTDLTPDTTYHYRVKSTDESGNEVVSPDMTFTTPISGLQPGSEWTYKASFETYEDWLAGEGTEVTTWTYTLAARNVMPQDLGPCEPVAPAVLSDEILIDHMAGGSSPLRQPATAPVVITYWNSTFWVGGDPDDGMLGQILYWALDGSVGFGNLRQEWQYRDFTLASGSNIGEPYAVGNSWRYDEFSQASIGGGPPGTGECLSTFTWPWLAEVVAENLTVTVPAGTFTDVFQIDHYCDWNRDGEFTHGDASVSELTRTEYYSPSAMARVKWYDYLTFDGPPGGLGGTNVGPPPEFVEVYELSSYDLILA